MGYRVRSWDVGLHEVIRLSTRSRAASQTSRRRGDVELVVVTELDPHLRYGSAEKRSGFASSTMVPAATNPATFIILAAMVVLLRG